MASDPILRTVPLKSWPKYFKKWYAEEYVPIVQMVSRRAKVDTTGSGIPAPLISNDWTSYANSAAMRTALDTSPYDIVQASDQIFLDSYGGYTAMRYDFQDPGSGVPQIEVTLPYPLEDCWYATRVAFKNGFTPVGSGGGNSAYKFLGMKWNPGLEMRTTVEFSGDQFLMYTGMKQGGTGRQEYTIYNDGHIVNQWSDGLYYEYLLHHKVLSATEWRVRHFQCALGGTPTFVMAVTYFQESSFPMEKWGISLGENMNQPPVDPQPKSIYWRDFRVWDGLVTPNPLSFDTTDSKVSLGLSSGGSISVARGAAGTITVTPTRTAYTADITFEAQINDGFINPGNYVAPSWSINPVTNSDGSTVLTLTVDAGCPVGKYLVDIRATGTGMAMKYAIAYVTVT